MEQLHNTDKSGGASQLSPLYCICFCAGLFLAVLAVALLLPYVIQFCSDQIGDITAKTNAALRLM